jgi:hypothetical protein
MRTLVASVIVCGPRQRGVRDAAGGSSSREEPVTLDNGTPKVARINSFR